MQCKDSQYCTQQIKARITLHRYYVVSNLRVTGVRKTFCKLSLSPHYLAAAD